MKAGVMMRRVVDMVAAAVLAAVMFILPATVKSARAYLVWFVVAVVGAAALGLAAEAVRLRELRREAARSPMSIVLPAQRR